MSPSADERRLLLIVPAAFLASYLGSGAPLAAVPLAIAVSLWLLRKHPIVAALLVVIVVHSSIAISNLDAAATRPVAAEVVELGSDPRPTDFGWRAEGRIGSDRVRVESRAIPMGRLGPGDRLVVSGAVVGERPNDDWTIARRLVGRLRIDELHHRFDATGPAAWATRFRRMLTDGAVSLGPGRRALFSGLTFGDDRDQDPVTADDFRAAGLGHLLAVSGQNVVFVLVLAMPVLSRVVSLRLRLGLTLAVLVAFGFVTRFEPSVSRALVMAALVAVGSARGSPLRAVRVLPMAVLGLLVVDPLLARSLAFQLSVAATAGLIVLSPRLEGALWGPSWVRLNVGATLGAQLAVAPILLSSFGSVSLLAVPANALAAPAAAFVMMWGLTAGVVAAVAPEEVASILHLPTEVAIGWIEAIASSVAAMPVGVFGWTHLASAVLGLALFASGGRRRRIGAALAALAVLTPLVAAPQLPAGRHRLAAGVELVRSGTGADVVILDRSGGVASVLQALRVARVGRIDLLVSTRGDRGAGRVVRVVDRRHDVTDVWAPPGHQVPAARVAPEEGGWVGPLVVRLDPSGDVFVFDTPVGATSVGVDDRGVGSGQRHRHRRGWHGRRVGRGAGPRSSGPRDRRRPAGADQEHPHCGGRGPGGARRARLARPRSRRVDRARRRRSSRGSGRPRDPQPS